MNVASFESLEFLFSPHREKYFVVAFPGSPLADLTHENYPASQILPLKIHSAKTLTQKQLFSLWNDEKKLVQKTNISNLARHPQIDAMMPDCFSSLFLERWAKEQRIRLIATPRKFQRKIENKIFFDQFLRAQNLPAPRSWILKSDKDLDAIDRFPSVVQIPDSNGSLGTFIVHSKKEIRDLISSHKKVKYPLLCREFIDRALPLGVSIVVGPKNMIFSAIRVQAYFSQKNGRSVYYGIQWQKTSAFSPKVLGKLNASLIRAGKALQDMGFRGIAAFDFMLRDEEIYFLECNPRLGGSTPQVSLRPELLHGCVFTDELIRSTTGQELTCHKPFIPDSVYEGFNLDISFLADLYPAKTLLHTPKTGFYTFSQKTFRFLSSRVSDFQTPSTLFLYFVRPQNSELEHGVFNGFLMMHFPLLQVGKNNYTFLPQGKEFLQNVTDFLLKK